MSYAISLDILLTLVVTLCVIIARQPAAPLPRTCARPAPAARPQNLLPSPYRALSTSLHFLSHSLVLPHSLVLFCIFLQFFARLKKLSPMFSSVSNLFLQKHPAFTLSLLLPPNRFHLFPQRVNITALCCHFTPPPSLLFSITSAQFPSPRVGGCQPPIATCLLRPPAVDCHCRLSTRFSLFTVHYSLLTTHSLLQESVILDSAP
jgi:hypothetical protein